MLFTAGGIATPADAAMMMQLGAEGVFVGSGIFKSGDPAQRAAAIVQATTFYDDPDVIAKVSRGLGEPMVGINVSDAPRERALRRPAAGDRRRLIGVLALQGDVREHLAALTAAGAAAGPVRRPEELAEVDGLVVPGGESTTMANLAARFGLLEPLRAAVRGGLPAYGSCAGMIMLADTVLDAPAGPGDHRRARRDRAPQRVRPAGRLLRERRRVRPVSPGRRCTRVFIRAPWVEEVGRGRRGPRPGRGRTGRR